MWWQLLLAGEVALTLLGAMLVTTHFLHVRWYAVHAARRMAALALALSAVGVALLALAVGRWQREPALAALTMAPACLSQLLLGALVLRQRMGPHRGGMR